MINVVYFGYRKWAKDIAARLLKSHSKNWKIKTVFTTLHPDIPFESLPVSVHRHDPKDLDSTYVRKILKTIKPSVLLFYGWSWYIPASLYESYTTLILHPSPLPKYRGGSPIQNQIIAGETSSAVTILRVVEKLDAGDIYAQSPISLNGTLDQILARIVTAGTASTIRVLDAIATNHASPIAQNEHDATIGKRRKPTDSEITLDEMKNKSSAYLYNKIRSLADPYPTAYIICKDGKKLYLTGARLDEH